MEISIEDVQQEINQIINTDKKPIRESELIKPAQGSEHEIHLLKTVQASIKIDPQTNEIVDPQSYLNMAE